MIDNNNSWQRPTLPQKSAVPSALESLTAVFGMGTGVASPLLSPGNLISYLIIKISAPFGHVIFWSSAPRSARAQLTKSLKAAQATLKNKSELCLVKLLLFRSSPRSISTGQLNTLLHLHTRPINHLVLMGSYPRHLRAGWENSS